MATKLELERQVEFWRVTAERRQCETQDLRAEIAAKDATIERLERDRERLDWLERELNIEPKDFGNDEAARAFVENGGDLRSAIDFSMEAGDE